MREALDYLKQRERIPQHLREAALSKLGGLYGIGVPASTPAAVPPPVAGYPGVPGTQPMTPREYAALQNHAFFGNTDRSPLGGTNYYARYPWLAQQQAQQPVQEQAPVDPGFEVGGQQELIDYARQSPLYAAIMGNLRHGEDSITRNAAATGGLRSGGVQENLASLNIDL